METIYIVFGLLALFMIAQAVFADRSPIPETSGKVYKISAPSELESVLASNTHVVVDFYADWCPPCRAIAPVFSNLADAHASEGQLAFAKVNTDHVKDVAAKYGISAMPTFVFFENGVAKGVQVEGVKSRAVGFPFPSLPLPFSFLAHLFSRCSRKLPPFATVPLLAVSSVLFLAFERSALSKLSFFATSIASGGEFSSKSPKPR